MKPATSPLDRVRVASPCPESWEGMTGDDRSRFCGRCRMNVYNLSGMTRPEAEALVSRREGRVCIRYFQRADGTIQTLDCPVGLSALRRRVAAFAGKIVALFALALPTTGCGARPGSSTVIPGNSKLRQIEPTATLLKWIDPVPPTPAVAGKMVMGAPPPPPPAPPVAGRMIMGDVCPTK